MGNLSLVLASEGAKRARYFGKPVQVKLVGDFCILVVRFVAIAVVIFVLIKAGLFLGSQF